MTNLKLPTMLFEDDQPLGTKPKINDAKQVGGGRLTIL